MIRFVPVDHRYDRSTRIPGMPLRMVLRMSAGDLNAHAVNLSDLSLSSNWCICSGNRDLALEEHRQQQKQVEQYFRSSLLEF